MLRPELPGGRRPAQVIDSRICVLAVRCRPHQPLVRVPKPLASVVMFATGVPAVAAPAGVPVAEALSAAEVLRSMSAAK